MNAFVETTALIVLLGGIVLAARAGTRRVGVAIVAVAVAVLLASMFGYLQIPTPTPAWLFTAGGFAGGVITATVARAVIDRRRTIHEAKPVSATTPTAPPCPRCDRP